MIKKLYYDGSAANDLDQTRPALLRVSHVINEKVGNTLGPGGRNYMTPLGITNDGVSILKEIRFSDERDDSIASAFEELAMRQFADAGDGTTTATVTGTQLVKNVIPDVTPIETPGFGKNVMEIKRQLEEECRTAVQLLEESKNSEVTLSELENVARTALEDHESAPLIAETVHALGYNSNTFILEGFNGKISTEVVPGIHFPLKIETPAMFTNETRKETQYDEALVLVVNHVFEAYSDLSRFFKEMIDSKSKAVPIVIIGKSFSVPFTAQVVAVSRQIKLPILLLNANGLKDEEMMDIAEFTGAKYLDSHPKQNSTPLSISFDDAGHTQKMIAGPLQTSFTGGKGIETGRVSIRVADLQKLATTEQDSDKRELLLRRAAGLQGGVATFYVDAKTAVDRYYLKKKVENAINSCKAALEHGTIAGGGLALKEVASKMPADSYLGRTLSIIHERVQQNAGGNLQIDPLLVRDAFYTNKCAIENAVAVAKILVTMEGVIADRDTDLTDDLARKLNLQ